MSARDGVDQSRRKSILAAAAFPTVGLWPSRVRSAQSLAIESFAWPTSAEPGGTVSLYARTTVPPQLTNIFPVRIFRCPNSPFSNGRATKEFIYASFTFTFGFSNPSTSESNNIWESAVLSIGTWPAGLYMARIGDDDLYSDTYFVIRRSSQLPSAKILCVLPFLTAQAYNPYGFPGSAHSLYQFNSPLPLPDPTTVSLMRPLIYAYLAGKAVGYEDFVDGASGRLRIFLGWLDQKVAVSQIPELDYISDADLATGNFAISGNQGNIYRAVLFLGHCEYWPRNMVHFVYDFALAGGNVGFFSGNTCEGAITLGGGGTTMTYIQGDRWYNPPVAPEVPNPKLPNHNSIQLKLVGMRTSDTDTAQTIFQQPYTLAAPWVSGQFDHWALRGLPKNVAFGLLADSTTIVGYETDSLYSNSPTNFQTLGTTAYNSVLKTSFGTFEIGSGNVFVAGTGQWARGLADGNEASGVPTVTLNVIQKFSGSTGSIQSVPRSAQPKH
jgi:hypothetical protein